MKPRRSFRILSLAALVTALSVFAASPAFAAGAELNPAFGSGTGYVVTGPSTSFIDSLIAPDGSVYVAGSISDMPTVFKYLPSGALDMSFNASGTPGYLSLTSYFNGIYSSLAIQADGNIVAVGRVQLYGGGGDFQAVVSRLTPQGAFDTTFAGTGTYELTDTGGEEWFSDVAIAPNNNIFATGSVPNGIVDDGLILGLTPTGTLTTGFNSNAVLVVPGKPAIAIAITADNKVVVASTFVGNLVTEIAVQRYTEFGVSDVTFGATAGQTLISSVAGGMTVSDLAVDPAGIFFVGNFADNTSLSGLYGRLTPAGLLDTTFAPQSTTPGLSINAGFSYFNSIARTSDGKYLLSGSLESQNNSVSASQVVRVGSNGVVDPTFSPNSLNPGTFSFAATGLTYVISTSISLNSNGVIYVTGRDFSNLGTSSFIYSLVDAPAPNPALAATGMNSSTFFLASGVAVATVLVGVLVVMRTRKNKFSS